MLCLKFIVHPSDLSYRGCVLLDTRLGTGEGMIWAWVDGVGNQKVC